MASTLLKESMSTHLITIGWEETMKNAYQRMQSNHVRHLPVLNETGEVIGMLSDRDVQRSMISQLDRPSGRAMADESIEFDPESRVRDYMTWPAKVVGHGTSLKTVVENMIREKVSSFLVSDGKRVIGIVTVEDLLRVLLEFLIDPKGQPVWTLRQVLDYDFDPYFEESP